MTHKASQLNFYALLFLLFLLVHKGKALGLVDTWLTQRDKHKDKVT